MKGVKLSLFLKRNSPTILSIVGSIGVITAIISAVNACPENACIDIYTDSKYSILTLEKDFKPNINGDLWELYQKHSRHVAGVRLHWVKGHNGDHYNEMADELAYSAYCEICEKFGIKKTNRH